MLTYSIDAVSGSHRNQPQMGIKLVQDWDVKFVMQAVTDSCPGQ